MIKINYTHSDFLSRSTEIAFVIVANQKACEDLNPVPRELSSHRFKT